jgi:SAM-dependent methyltransferase
MCPGRRAEYMVPRRRIRSMSIEDRRRWDARHAGPELEPAGEPFVPSIFAACAHLLPDTGHALEIACGCGRAALWLAARGMLVHAVDISPVAIGQARALLARNGYVARVRFEVFDLDQGLPAGPPCALLLCHNFRDARLYRPMLQRLAPGGILAIAALSEVGATRPGPFHARPGELRRAFAALEPLAEGERDGRAWLVGRRR